LFLNTLILSITDSVRFSHRVFNLIAMVPLIRPKRQKPSGKGC